MARRRWRPACSLLIAIALAVAVCGIVLAGVAVAPTNGAERERLREVGADVSGDVRSTLVAAEPTVPSVLPARRTGAPGAPFPLLLTLIAVRVACAVASRSAIRARSRTDLPHVPALVAVPCGTRAPPAFRFS